MTSGKNDEAKGSVTKRKPSTVKTPKIDKSKKEVGNNASAYLPIVGIGASAGGLEALELFITNVPENSGMAFVIVQHLDPTHKGVMVELLQRGTRMKVAQVKDRMRIEANHVYIIPPNKNMSVLHGVLYLLDMISPRGLRLPIDFFFRSLADDQQEHAICVILSGMGSDGTLGLRAIKEKAGVVFVQDPASAKFNGMPNSAIETGMADVIAPAQDLPDKITDYLRHIPLIEKSGKIIEDKSQSGLDKVVILLRGKTGHDFSLYKKSTIYRRIERRMGLHQIHKISHYVRFLQQNPQEVELLFRELLIGVTSFFRDPEAWEQMKAEVLPVLLTGRTSDKPIRAWIPACSSGEEAYSLAMLFAETLEENNPDMKIPLQIFATDLDPDAIEKAREGVFPANIAADVSEKRLDRFFTKTDRGYQVIKSIRETVIFAPQDIIMDPPFTKLDFLSCRNLLIYLMPELHKKLLSFFHYSLKPGGFLFLGSAETVGSFTNLFEPLSGKSRLYRRLDHSISMEAVGYPPALSNDKSGAKTGAKKPTENLQTLADQLLLQTYAPAAVLTTNQGDILFINGRTGKYLEPCTGKANWNIFAMAREGLSHELTHAFQKVLHKKETITLRNLETDIIGGKQIVNITVQPMIEPNALNGMVMVVFNDVAEKPGMAGRSRKGTVHTKEIEQAMEHARQEIQDLHEEMQTSQEELKSANEELQSANEELQSTNEELTTSKEELQTMNEELHTVNQELQSNLDELSITNADMKNLLDSTRIATLFLDKNLCIRRFTSETGKITRLIPADKGRPITDIASALFYPELVDDARQVLRTLSEVEKQISIPDGNWFETRILPYRTVDNRIDGVVITFLDITVSKKLEAELRATESRLHKMPDRKTKKGQ